MNILFTRISGCFLVFIFCIHIFSCLGQRGNLPKPIYLSRGKISHSDIAKDVQQKAGQGLDTMKDLNRIIPSTEMVLSKNQETINSMTNSNTTSELVNHEINTLFNKDAAPDLLSIKYNIDTTNASILKGLKDDQKKSEDILSFLSPDSLKAILDSIVVDKLVEYSKTKDYFKITQAEKDAISKEARAEVQKMIEEKYAEIVKTDGDISLLMWKRNFVMIQERILAANLSLQKLAVTASSNSYYDTGKDFLSHKQDSLLRKNIGLFFDGMFDTLRNIFSSFHNDTCNYIGQIKIFADGYADLQEYKTIDKYHNNDSLSQRRADKIMVIIKGIYYEKIGQTKFQNVRFLSPIPSAVGHGINYPEQNQKYLYETNGVNDDPKRRTSILRFSFAVTLSTRQEFSFNAR